MNDIQSQIKKQDETISLLRRLIEQMKEDRVHGSGNSNINVNAGGVGVWTAVTACLMTLAACVPTMIMLAVIVVDQGRKLDRLQDHVNVIYRATPALKPKQEPSK